MCGVRQGARSVKANCVVYRLVLNEFNVFLTVALEALVLWHKTNDSIFDYSGGRSISLISIGRSHERLCCCEL